MPVVEGTEKLVGARARARSRAEGGEGIATAGRKGEGQAERDEGDAVLANAGTMGRGQVGLRTGRGGVERSSYSRYFTRVPPNQQASGRFRGEFVRLACTNRLAPLDCRAASQHLMPLGVTGNTSASGAEESRFDPWRGN